MSISGIPPNNLETLISIDATTGQNGLRQAKAFAEATDVDGVVLTKLDDDTIQVDAETFDDPVGE